MSKKIDKNIASFTESWAEEKQSAYLYRLVSKCEKHKPYSQLFLQLAHEADSQAEIWAQKIKQAGGEIPAAYKPNLRARATGWLVQQFGPRQMRSILAAMKVRGMAVYLKGEPQPHAMPRTIADVGLRHHGTGMAGNNLRAAVFGINDGLVSNASLIMGMAGASSSNSIIILAGIAGLLAGAFSMAAGEYISVRSQREMFEYQIGLEKKELELYPKEETAELALIYHARGLPKDEAKKVAEILMQNPEHALDTLAREELGINPDEMVSPIGACISSFFSFAIGACIPLAPFLFKDYWETLPVSIGVTCLSLFIVGAILSLFTGRNAIWGGLRMLAIGVSASVITYYIGSLLGVKSL